MNDYQSKTNKVVNRVPDLYGMLRDDVLIPNAKTQTSLVDSLTKGGQIDNPM